MKLKSKYKWVGVAMIFILGIVCMYMSFTYMSIGMIFLGYALIIIGGAFGVYGIVQYKIVERLAAWLKTDDV